MGDIVPEETKRFLRAVLISSTGGVRLSRLASEYKEWTNETLKWRDYGFKTLLDFLQSIPDTVKVVYKEKHKENVAFAIEDSDSYTSLHAKKATWSVAKGGAPPKPVTPASKPSSTLPNKTSSRSVSVGKTNEMNLKVTVSQDQSKENILPDSHGLYALYVGNLPESITQEKLRSLFQGTGCVETKVVKNSRNHQVGFVRFKEAKQAIAACKKFDGFHLQGSNLTVRPADHGGTTAESTTSEVYPVFVTGFTDMIPAVDIRRLFEKYGRIANIRSGPKFLFVKFHNKSDADAAVRDNNILTWRNDKLKIELGKQHPINKLEQQPQAPSQNQRKVSVSQNTTGANQNQNNTLPKTQTHVPSYDRQETDWEVSSNWDPEENLPSQTSSVSEQSRRPSLGLHGSQQTQDTKGPVQKVVQDLERVVPKPNPPVENVAIPVGFLDYLSMTSMFKKALSKKSPRTELDFPQKFNILITEVVSGNHFWGHANDGSEAYDQLVDLQGKLQTMPHNPCQTLPSPYQFGAAKFKDGIWYRCYVLQVSKENFTIQIFYVDYGNIEWTTLSKFVLLEESFWTLSPQAVPFFVSGPSNLSTLNDHAQIQTVLSAEKSGQGETNQPHVIRVKLASSGGATPSVPSTPPPSLMPFSPEDLVDVKVVQVKSPQVVLICKKDPKLSNVIENMLMRVNVNNKVVVPKPKMMVCYHEDGGDRHRVIIEGPIMLQSGKVPVYFVDSGQHDTVLLENLAAVPTMLEVRLKELPYQADFVHLAGLEDLSGQDSVKLVSSHIVDITFKGHFVDEDSPGKPLQVELFDQNTNQSINLFLLEESRKLKNSKGLGAQPSNAMIVNTTANPGSGKPSPVAPLSGYPGSSNLNPAGNKQVSATKTGSPYNGHMEYGKQNLTSGKPDFSTGQKSADYRSQDSTSIASTSSTGSSPTRRVFLKEESSSDTGSNSDGKSTFAQSSPDLSQTSGQVASKQRRVVLRPGNYQDVSTTKTQEIRSVPSSNQPSLNTPSINSQPNVNSGAKQANSQTESDAKGASPSTWTYKQPSDQGTIGSKWRPSPTPQPGRDWTRPSLSPIDQSTKVTKAQTPRGIVQAQMRDDQNPKSSPLSVNVSGHNQQFPGQNNTGVKQQGQENTSGSQAFGHPVSYPSPQSNNLLTEDLSTRGAMKNIPESTPKAPHTGVVSPSSGIYKPPSIPPESTPGHHQGASGPVSPANISHLEAGVNNNMSCSDPGDWTAEYNDWEKERHELQEKIQTQEKYLSSSNSSRVDDLERARIQLEKEIRVTELETLVMKLRSDLLLKQKELEKEKDQLKGVTSSLQK